MSYILKCKVSTYVGNQSTGSMSKHILKYSVCYIFANFSKRPRTFAKYKLAVFWKAKKDGFYKQSQNGPVLQEFMVKVHIFLPYHKIRNTVVCKYWF